MGKAKGRHKVEHLTAAFCKSAKPGRHTDGRGLYLVVEPTGAKRWMQRFQMDKKRQDIGLGPYPAVGLADARAKAHANREMIERGLNPVTEKQKAAEALKLEKARQTFQEAVDSYLSLKLVAFRNAKHRQQWRNTLEQYTYPVFGKKPVDEVDTDDVVRALRPIWLTKTETARRLRGRIEAVLNAAKVAGQRTGENPARWRGHLSEVLPSPKKIVVSENQPSVTLKDVQRWFGDLKRRDGMGARALEFLALTWCRSGEVRGAQWAEVDLDRAVWTVPAQRMKASREHRVPLSQAAIRLLECLPRYADTNLIFPAPRGGQLSDMTLSAVMKRIHETAEYDKMLTGGGFFDERNGRPAVPHGLRSTARDWAAEMTSFPGDLAELALAHKISNAVEAAYRRGDMLEKRREMMEAWSNFLSPTRESEKVVPIRR